MAETNGSHPLRILLLDSPRTCSQLFRRLFQNHPQVDTSVMHLYASPWGFGPERIALRLKNSPEAQQASIDWAEAVPDRATQTYESALVSFEKTVQDIESQGKIPFMKEHNVTLMQQDITLSTIRDNEFSNPQHRNPSYLPDSLLLTFSPVFLIRHPAQMVPSNYRIGASLKKLKLEDEDSMVQTTQRWTRYMWDYLATKSPAQKPILIDAEDLINNAEATVLKLCNILGIDPSGVEYSWDAVPKEQWPEDGMGIAKTYLGDLLVSKGVTKSEKGLIDIDVETEKWAEQYGQEIARALRARVDKEMPDYDYLRQFKLTV
ncbi:hypothetical protein LTR56_022159 [Elasticomyces elasticus]|nr:hypothetical protein LTR56_022159 [Elasticomyces elasticus]KAK3628616.1 hypothetical protein LTR22_022301 [Elasticomyces elasticus]KAK4913407.1 hypothetical protein LTR49_018295 [Elasticomyces elasticus]KAK5754613.1 hypothetical protein LTS12_015337 [Elasticomyces elasticus]